MYDAGPAGDEGGEIRASRRVTTYRSRGPDDDSEANVTESGAVGRPVSLLAAGAAALARSDDLDSAVAAILDAALPILGADGAAVFLQDPDRTALELVGAGGLDPEAIERLRTSLGQGDDPVATTARDRARVDLDGSQTSPFLAATGWSSASFQPLLTRRAGIDEPGGVLAVGWTTARGGGSDDEAIIAATADLIAVAAERSRLAATTAERSEWFERMAHSDPLTGLANARTFHRVLELEVARASRQGGEVSVAMFDVDGFGATNERKGSSVGDDVLRQVAAVLSESVRLVDTVARWGGDEFVLVAPGSAGLTVARRVLDGIARLDDVDGVRVSVSGGVAHFPKDGADAEALLDAAEAAMQRAKTDGGRIEEASTQRTG